MSSNCLEQKRIRIIELSKLLNTTAKNLNYERKIKNILVTGGGQNFGLQLVKNFLLYPNLNIIILTRNPNKLKKELKGYKNIFQYKPTDFTNKILINKIQKSLGIDVLINNATLNAQKNFSKFIENSDDKSKKLLSN